MSWKGQPHLTHLKSECPIRFVKHLILGTVSWMQIKLRLYPSLLPTFAVNLFQCQIKCEKVDMYKHAKVEQAPDKPYSLPPSSLDHMYMNLCTSIYIYIDPHIYACIYIHTYFRTMIWTTNIKSKSFTWSFFFFFFSFSSFLWCITQLPL